MNVTGAILMLRKRLCWETIHAAAYLARAVLNPHGQSCRGASDNNQSIFYHHKCLGAESSRNIFSPEGFRRGMAGYRTVPQTGGQASRGFCPGTGGQWPESIAPASASQRAASIIPFTLNSENRSRKAGIALSVQGTVWLIIELIELVLGRSLAYNQEVSCNL